MTASYASAYARNGEAEEEQRVEMRVAGMLLALWPRGVTSVVEEPSGGGSSQWLRRSHLGLASFRGGMASGGVPRLSLAGPRSFSQRLLIAVSLAADVRLSILTLSIASVQRLPVDSW